MTTKVFIQVVISILIFETSHMTLAAICNYLLLLSLLYFLYHQQAPQLDSLFRGVTHTFLNSCNIYNLAWIGLLYFSLILIIGHNNTAPCHKLTKGKTKENMKSNASKDLLHSKHVLLQFHCGVPSSSHGLHQSHSPNTVTS